MPAPTYTLLDSVTLASSASSVTFSAIDQSYGDLVLVAEGKKETAGGDQFALRFNGDAGNNYNAVWAEAYGTSNWSAVSNNSTWIITSQAFSLVGSTMAGLLTAHIQDYSSTDKHKTTLSRANKADAGVNMMAGRWANTAAITSVTITSTFSNYAVGSTFYLYGIEK